MPLPLKTATPLLVLLSACGGGGGNSSSPPAPVPIDSGPFETYQTDHNGFARVRLDLSKPEDAAVLQQFEDGDASEPAGYRNLIAQSEALYGQRMFIEVIAEVDPGNGDRATRLLRLTADQSPFENIKNGRPMAASGKYYFRGESFAWVTIDDGPLLSGHHQQGLENLVLDFDTHTASIDIRTEVARSSDVEISLSADSLPFDMRTGAYGGEITINVRDPNIAASYAVDGNLRGNVGGTPVYTDGVHGMSTSGLYAASGTAGGTAVTIDGVYRGVDPNALP